MLYFQNIEDAEALEVEYEQYKIKVDDVLKIDIDALDISANQIFGSENVSSQFNNNETSFILDGYQVNSSGNISYPILGEFHVQGLTLTEIKDLFQKRLLETNFLTNPSVDIKLINSYFTILGEVNIPGRHTFLKNNLNIIEAIGIGGDLTINGERKNVRLLRDIDGTLQSFTINLNSYDFISSPAFQIIPGDIIIINPNLTRVKNAGIIGNSGTLLSLLSFILSSIIVISR